jgi:multiple sugar transport system substrate-binding protein
MFKRLCLTAAMLGLTLSLLDCTNVNNSDKVIIRYSAPGYALYDKIRTDLGEDFQKENPGIITKYEPVTGQAFFEKILTQLASGTEPDVYFMRDFTLPEFITRDAFLPLDEFIRKDPGFDLNDFYPALVDAYRYDGKIYGLPGSFTTGVIYYNKNILSSEGLKSPLDLSWENLLKYGKNLQKTNGGIVSQFPLVLEYYDWVTLIFQNGGKFFNEDNTRCVINSVQAIEAITFMKDLIKKYHYVPNTTDLQQSQADQFFMLGRCGLFTGGRWYSTTFRTITSFEWGIMPMFHGKKRATRLDSHAWVISKRTKHPEAAWKLVKYLTGKEGNGKMVSVGDSVPTHKSDLEKFIRANPENQVFIDSLSYSYPAKKIMNPRLTWSEMNQIINTEFDLFILDKQDAGSTLLNIETRVNRAISQKKR